MTVPDQDVLNKVIRWAEHADEDIRLARHARTMMEECPYRLIAYHAQQCAEKYLKAYLVLRGIDFPYTHSISRLLELSSEDTDWPGTLRDAEELAPYAITARYPGEDEAVAAFEADRAIQVAEKVRETVRQKLAELGAL